MAQLVMPAVRGQDLGAVARSLGALGVGGIVVMTWPAGTTAASLDALKKAGAVPMLAAVDEEGGSVQRLRTLGVVPSEADVAATMTPDQARQLIAGHARKVAALGFDVVFAPVVDVTPDSSGGPIGDRSFGSDPATVTTYASAYVEAWESAGVLPVLKHFPGHGRASADSHLGVVTTPSLASLRAIDLVPYRQLAGSGAGVMVGHLDVPGLTEQGVPSSLSPAAIAGLLRGQLGYRDALVVTDALGMGAVASRFTVSEAAVRAIAAGADIALLSGTADAAAVVAALAKAVRSGRISAAGLDAALRHVLSAKHVSC